MNDQETSYETYSPSEIKSRFRALGKTLTDWAIENGFRREEVYALLNGRTKGDRGRSHEIAVRLGIKPDPDELINDTNDRLWQKLGK